MGVDRAIAIMLATISRREFPFRARREDWDWNTMIMIVDSRRAVYNSLWSNDEKPIPTFVKAKYDPYAPLQFRWTFDLGWKVDELDRSLDWDLSTW